MTDVAGEIERSGSALLTELRGESGPSAELSLTAATPLDALAPDLVRLVVGRTQAGVTAFGDDHPRASVTRRVVAPSLVLAAVDAVGLVIAAATGRTVPAAVAAVLLVVLGYLAFAGVRFVRQDPLRVTPAHRERVASARLWVSSQPWDEAGRRHTWARLVQAACGTTARVAASEAWTWASLAAQRGETQLASNLDDIDAVAFRLTSEDAAVPSTADEASEAAALVRRVAALTCYADGLEDLVRRADGGEDVRSALPAADEARLGALVRVARDPVRTGEPS